MPSEVKRSGKSRVLCGAHLGAAGGLLLFGLSFLLAGRIRADQSGGMKVLFMAAPIGKAEYLLGKWLGNFVYTLSMFFVHLLVHTAAYSLLNTAPFLWRDTLLPLFSAVIYIMLPACFFVATCSVMLPAVLDVRLFYMDYVCDNPFAPMPPSRCGSPVCYFSWEYPCFRRSPSH